MRRPATLAAGSLLGLLLGACFTGEATLGAICKNDGQCGLDQACTSGVCGMCRDGLVQPGELCYGASSEELAFGEVTDLLAIDINEDGFKDLLAIVNDDCEGLGGSCWDMRLFVLDDQGDFQSLELFDKNVPGRVPKMSIANFDGDGTPDVVAVVVPFDTQEDASQLAVLYDFPNVQTSLDIDIPVFANTLEAADLDGNGFDDLLVAAELANTLVFVPSIGTDFGVQRIIVTDPAPRLATPADMDGDGDLDLIIGSAATGSLGVDLNDGKANFVPQTRQQLGAGMGVSVISTADFDSDGKLDVAAIVEGSEPIVALFRGLGNGLLEPLDSLPAGSVPVDLLTEDLNNDGLADIMIADLFEDKLPVYLNRAGSFPDRSRVDVAAAPLTLLRGDFDFDNIDDLVIGNANGVISVVRWEK